MLGLITGINPFGGIAAFVFLAVSFSIVKEMVKELLTFRGGRLMLAVFLMIFGYMGLVVFRLVSQYL